MNQPDHSNDSLLLLQIEQGNTMAFNVLYSKHWENAYRDAFRRLKDEDQAKDVVQEIFTTLWLNRESHIDNFPAYLHTAIRNNVFKIVENQKLMHPFLNVLEEVPAYLQADSDIRFKEFSKAYEALIETLPAKRQVIFRMRYQEDLTTKDIASKLELSRKTVQNQLGKAIEQLRMSFMHLFSLLMILLIK